MFSVFKKVKNIFSRKAEEVSIEKTVYWVESGKTYHTDRECPSLKRSKDVISGIESSCPKNIKCGNCK